VKRRVLIREYLDTVFGYISFLQAVPFPALASDFRSISIL
jgi:hypothetical protein